MTSNKHLDRAAVLKRNNVRIEGSGEQTLLLAHGFGCDQSMWRFLTPLLVDRFQVVAFDYVGSGNSDLSAFSLERYQSLEGYAQDVIDVCEAIEINQVVFVGHSISATIGMLASIARPELFSHLIMLSPSPCFLNRQPGYHGGFEEEDLQDLMDLMEKNYLGWASFLAPLVMGAQASDSMVQELEGSFCSTDPQAAKAFAHATFFSDYRDTLASVIHPVLVLQSSIDSLADVEVGRYTHARLPNSELKVIEAEGHCLHMTHPDAVEAALCDFVPE